MSDTSDYQWKAYRYTPNRGVNIEFTVLFGLLVVAGISQVIYAHRKFNGKIERKKLRRYTGLMIPFIVGSCLECVGYVCRLISAQNLDALGPYIIQSIFILIGPAFYAATIYMVLGEIIRVLGAEVHAFIPVRYMTKIFVIGDVVSLLLQAAGGGIQGGGTLEMLHLGEKLIIVGLFVQIAFFGFFIAVMGNFFIRCSMKPVQGAKAQECSSSFWLNWKFLLAELTLTSLFIMVRSIYRVIEYLQGNDGVLISDEKYLFILDSSMIFFAMVTILVANISQWLSKLRFWQENDTAHEMFGFVKPPSI